MREKERKRWMAERDNESDAEEGKSKGICLCLIKCLK
jgi:hypothetical protein